jgi:hypothetical protein
MPVIERASTPVDRQRIIDLLEETFEPGEVQQDPEVLQWKFWAPHPLFGGDRGQVIDKEGKLLAHGCIWPIQLVTSLGRSMCFHLIDWAARRDAAGAGMQVLRRCGAGLTAQFAIGGSAMTRQILPRVGFRNYNSLWFLGGSLPPLKLNLPAGWDVAIREPKEIPESLWPGVSPGLAIGMRSPQLLEHFSECPVIAKSLCCVLYKHSNPMAYLFLIQVGEQLRLADYGPAELDEETSMMLGQAVHLAKSSFPSTTEFRSVTSETGVLAGLLRAGFRLRKEEPIKVLKTGTGLEQIDHFRLTPLDWDLVCRR